MTSAVQIYSEIGKLKTVILHRPGREIENLVPDYLETLLFDDIPYLQAAAAEHDVFADILRGNGAQVLYLTDLAAEVLADENVKQDYVCELLEESHIHSTSLKEALTRYLMNLSTQEMIATVIAGVRKLSVRYRGSSLSDIIKSDYEFYLDPMPNLYFTRDPGACVAGGLLIGSMRTEARQRETLFLKYLYRYHPLFRGPGAPLWYDRAQPHSIEGGDVAVLSDKVIALGCSERTSPEAIECLTRNLFAGPAGFEKALVFEIQKKRAYMHLDTVFTMLDYDKFAIHPGIEDALNIYEASKGPTGRIRYRYRRDSLASVLKDTLGIDQAELIRCGGGDRITSSREQWNDGSNTLAVAPGVVVAYERNYVSNELLEKRGVKVMTMPSSELSRGRGGPRCMSMPVARERV